MMSRTALPPAASYILRDLSSSLSVGSATVFRSSEYTAIAMIRSGRGSNSVSVSRGCARFMAVLRRSSGVPKTAYKDVVQKNLIEKSTKSSIIRTSGQRSTAGGATTQTIGPM